MNPTAATDEELVRRAKTGDEAAFSTLLDRWLPRLRSRARRVLRGILRRRVAESDVIQDAYTTAFVRIDDFEDRGVGSFGRWLSKILENKLRDQLRQHVGTAKRAAGVEVSRADGGREHLVPSPEPTPSATVMGAERRAALRDAMISLPHDYREVLRMVHEERLPLAEIGRRTGRSANAACKIYGRAVDALGRILGETERA